MRKSVSAAAILAIALAGAGCATGQATSTTQTFEKTSASTTARAPAPQPPRQDDAAIAERDAQIDGEPVRLELMELHRSGATSTLTIRLSTMQPDGSAQIAGTFSDGVATGTEGIENYASLDAISLIDGKNRKRYLVARDSRGICVCDGDLSRSFVRPSAPIILSATFAAPPADIGAVDVAIPRFGTFRNVPVS